MALDEFIREHIPACRLKDFGALLDWRIAP